MRTSIFIVGNYVNGTDGIADNIPDNNVGYGHLQLVLNNGDLFVAEEMEAHLVVQFNQHHCVGAYCEIVGR